MRCAAPASSRGLYSGAVEAAEARRDRLTGQIAARLPEWSLAPVVAALQTMRGMALVNAATLIAELGDLSALRQSAPADGLSRVGAVRTFERRQRPTQGHYQGRQ
jgi:hypothetical protein